MAYEKGSGCSFFDLSSTFLKPYDNLELTLIFSKPYINLERFFTKPYDNLEPPIKPLIFSYYLYPPHLPITVTQTQQKPFSLSCCYYYTAVNDDLARTDFII